MEAITQAQRYFFEANGYLVIEDALAPDELARVRAAADEAEARWRSDTTWGGVRRPDLEQVMGILEYSPLFLDLAENPRVFPLVRELVGPDIMLLDHDYFITPPGATIHRGWHFDELFPGVHHPRSRLMVKVFYVLQDIPWNGGATVVLPGSHAFPMGKLPNPDVPEDLPGSLRLALPAGAAYVMAGRTWHCAGNNLSDLPRRLLIYNFGHKWMKPWDGYEPSDQVLAQATTPLRLQLLGKTDPYGPNAPWPSPEGAA